MKKSELRQLVREELKSILSESPRYASPGSYAEAESPKDVLSFMRHKRAKPSGTRKTEDNKLNSDWRTPDGKFIAVTSRQHPSGLPYYRISFYD